MDIDLTNLVASNLEELLIEGKVVIPESTFLGSSIRNLKDTFFQGKIIKLCDGNYQISGILRGIMVLPDDITLEDVEYSYSCEIEEDFGESDDAEENLMKIVQNRLDITELLWQNILVEIPSKIKNSKNENLVLEGDGWRLVTEEEIQDSNENPFSELSKLFDSRKE